MNINFMQNAIEIAQKSGIDIPVGAVIVFDGKIIAQAHNKKESQHDVTAHAEIIALREASQCLRNWRLNGCDIYVTLEPCPMCAWALMQSRVENIYFGSFDNLYGAFSVLPDMERIANSKLKYKGGIMEQECDALLKGYFEKMRENK